MSKLVELIPHHCRGGRGFRGTVRQLTLLMLVLLIVAGCCVWWLDRRIRREQGLIDVPKDGKELVSDQVPDFQLKDIRTGEQISLSESLGRPVVLFLGSFTCPRFYDRIPDMCDLYEKYHNWVDFRFIYIREPYHANPKFDQYICQNQAYDGEERIRAGLDLYGIEFPCMIDSSNRFDRAYHAYPARAIVVAPTGESFWLSQPGLARPEGLDVKAIERQLQVYMGSRPQ